MSVRLSPLLHLAGCVLLVNVLVLSLAPMAVLADPPPDVKVEVCHIPGNADQFHTREVGPGAFEDHLAHGDAPGSCNEYCEAFCDDGDACTVDDTDDCEGLGCPVIRDPVDCDDNNFCTYDTCDSVQGCVNTADLSKDGLVCDQDKICDGGACVPEPPADPCPCFTEQDVRAELADNGGFIQSCGSSQTEFGTIVDSTYIWYNDGDFVCAGEGNGEFCHNSALPALACVLITDSGNSVISSGTTSDEDATCREHIQTVCDEILSPESPSGANRPAELGPGTMPPVVEIDPSDSQRLKDQW